MKSRVIIVGTSSTALHAFSFIQDYDLFEVIGFAVDKKYKTSDEYLGLPLYELESLDKVIDKDSVKLFVAMLWNKLNSERRCVYEKLKEQGYCFANLISPTSRIRGKLRGDNCWFHDFTVVQNNAEIGSNVMVMSYALIGASAKVGNHCFCGAKSTIAGGCEVGEQSFVGINATIFDDRKVGEKCIIGACTTVKRDIPDYSLVKTDVSAMNVVTLKDQTIEDKLRFKLNRH